MQQDTIFKDLRRVSVQHLKLLLYASFQKFGLNLVLKASAYLFSCPLLYITAVLIF